MANDDLPKPSLVTPPETQLLPDSPTDGITSLQYLSNTLLASSSWDGCLRIYDTSRTNQEGSSSSASSSNVLLFSHPLGCPLLSLTFLETRGSDDPSSSSSSASTAEYALYVGALDGSIHQFVITATTITSTTSTTSITSHPPLVIGKHEKAVSCLSAWTIASPTSEEAIQQNVVASSSWDEVWKLWKVEPNASEPTTTAAAMIICQLTLPGKAFSMDVTTTTASASTTNTNSHRGDSLPRFVVATSGRRLVFIDVQTTSNSSLTASIVLDRESSLKYQTRCVRFFPNGIGLAVSSIEGRVAIDYMSELNIPTNNHKKYAFKCHRQGDLVYPVNCLAFYPTVHNNNNNNNNNNDIAANISDCTFATGGCDGTVVWWDGLAKRKLLSLPAFPTSIAALAVSPSGQQLAVASSYTFEEGEREHPRDEIYIRSLLPTELQSKK